MAFAGFKMTGPDCCCCRDIVTNSPAILRFTTNTLGTAVNSGLVGYSVTDYDYEAKNAVLFRRTAGDAFIQFADMESASPWTITNVIHDLGTRVFVNAAIDRRNSKIYFVEDTAGFDELYVINYDGTGEAYVADIDIGDDGGTTSKIGIDPKAWQYQHTTDCIYYWTTFVEYIVADALNVFHQQVRRVSSDGTGDTLIYQCTNSKDTRIHPSADGDIILSMAFDHVGGKLFVLELQRPGNVAVSTYQKYRVVKMDLDGTDQEVIISRDVTVSSPMSNVIGALAWSHKNGLLYTMEQRDGVAYTSDAAGGFFSYVSDGSDRTQVCPRTGISQDFSSTPLWLWCGFEKTGTGTEA